MDCSPFGLHNTGSLQEHTTVEERRVNQRALYYTLSKARVTHRRRELTRMAVAQKGSCCQICGYDRCIATLEFPHLNRTQKSFSIRGAGNTMSWDKMRVELGKCVLLCANCHGEVEAGTTFVPFSCILLDG